MAKAKPKFAEPPPLPKRRLVANVTVVLVKPLNATWDEAGSRLHDLRATSHRLLNAAVTGAVLASASGDGGDKALGRATRSAVKAQLARERESARDAYEKNPSEKLARRSVLTLPSVIEDTAAVKAKQAAADYLRKHAWRGDKSLPSFKGGAPIFLRDGSGAWSLKRVDGRSVVLALKLLPGRSEKTEFALGIDGDGAWGHIRRMLDRQDLNVKLGDCKIVYHERKRKWLAKMCYSWDAPELPALDTNKLFAVHRGMRVFLTYATSDGKVGDVRTGTVADGPDVLTKKAQWAARRGQLRAHKREQGRGSKGHGYKRRYETYRALDEIERNWVRTYCQQRAATIVSLALKFGCGTVVLEDYSAKAMADDAEQDSKEVARLIRQFPFAVLKTAIEWDCSKVGLRVIEVPSQFESITCPKCHNIDAEQDGGHGTFLCKHCALKRSVDAVAAWNMLNAAGSPDAFAKHDEKFKQAVMPPKGTPPKGRRRPKSRRPQSELDNAAE
jgi:IS605 OrfB family transposase